MRGSVPTREDISILGQAPFDEVDIPRKKRGQFLSALYGCLLKGEMSIAVVAGDRGDRYGDLLAAKYHKSCLYVCRYTEHVGLAAELVAGTKPWHRGSFCVVACDTSVIGELTGTPELMQLPIPEIERQVQGKIYGYFFPLDDLLVCYGGAAVENAVHDAVARIDGL
jgi:hypothetical protein